MLDDVKAVSILIVCSTRDEGKLVQQLMLASQLSNYQVRLSVKDAMDYMVKSSPDAVLLIASRDEDRLTEFFGKVRTRAFTGNPYIPIIVAMWRPEISHIKAAIRAGASEFLSMPATMETLVRAIHRAVFIGRPFIDIPGYFGPCRRRKQLLSYGTDRRKAPWEYSHPSLKSA